MVDDDIRKHIEKLKKEGVTDIAGRLGDDFYNDEELLFSLIGDYIYGQPNREQILDDLAKDPHFVNIVEKLRRL